MGARLDLVMELGTMFEAEFQRVDENGTPIPFTGKTVRFVAKESEATDDIAINELAIITDGPRAMCLVRHYVDFPHNMPNLIYDLVVVEDNDRLVFGQIKLIGGYY